jgi:hypothetical protein
VIAAGAALLLAAHGNRLRQAHRHGSSAQVRKDRQIPACAAAARLISQKPQKSACVIDNHS